MSRGLFLILAAAFPTAYVMACGSSADIPPPLPDPHFDAGPDADIDAGTVTDDEGGTGDEPAPMGNPVAGMCMGATKNVAYLYGTSGEVLLVGSSTLDSTWSWSIGDNDNNVMGLYEAWVDVVAPMGQTGGPWHFDFGTAQIGSDTQLDVGDYPNAQYTPFTAPGHPSMDINANGCSMVNGQFVLNGDFHVLEIVGGKNGVPITSFTVEFWQQCGMESGTLYGCLHYGK